MSEGDAKVDPVLAAIWTAIGLLAATSLGTLFYLGARIDTLGSRMESRFDALEGRIDNRFASVDTRLDAINSRVDAHLRRHAG